MIYIAINRAAGALKIGSSENPAHRLSQLRTASPDEIECLGLIPGGVAEEKLLHAQFSDWHIRGEWFRADPELLGILEGMIEQHILSPERRAPHSLQKGKKILLNAWHVLTGQIIRDGRAAFSLKGPEGETIDEGIKNLAFWIWRVAGKPGMHLVYDAVDEWACRHCPGDAEFLLACLDKRFNGVGGWVS